MRCCRASLWPSKWVLPKQTLTSLLPFTPPPLRSLSRCVNANITPHPLPLLPYTTTNPAYQDRVVPLYYSRISLTTCFLKLLTSIFSHLSDLICAQCFTFSNLYLNGPRPSYGLLKLYCGSWLLIEYPRFHCNDCEMEVMDLQVLLSSDCMGSQKTSLLVYLFDLSVICHINISNTAAP